MQRAGLLRLLQRCLLVALVYGLVGQASFAFSDAAMAYFDTDLLRADRAPSRAH